MPDETMTWIYDNGGRFDAGFHGEAGDCVVRAIAIATEQDYKTVYDALNALARKHERRKTGRSNSRTGVHKPIYDRYMRSLGWTFVPTMGIGTGCQVHLRADELPPGRLVVSVSRHMVAVIDGVCFDTADPTRGGTRCCYGYYCRQED